METIQRPAVQGSEFSPFPHPCPSVFIRVKDFWKKVAQTVPKNRM